jgi:flavodoxin/NAD-dependent dihydropyrimidine dehydrogenase PreA subunit
MESDKIQDIRNSGKYNEYLDKQLKETKMFTKELFEKFYDAYSYGTVTNYGWLVNKLTILRNRLAQDLLPERRETMILYFSGTGNSRYITRKIGTALGEDIVSVNDRIRSGDHSEIRADRLIFVMPTYAWRIPRVVEDWINKTQFTGGAKAYFVMNCGDEIGNAGKYTARLCKNKGFCDMGIYEVPMPENYIAIYSAPDEEEAGRIISAAASKISEAIACIKEGKYFPSYKTDFADKVKSGLFNPFFYRFIVKDKQFIVTDNCISCGRCEKVCPLNNIQMADGKPKWSGHCTHCMACICTCPKEAIEYGKHTKGLRRYYCEEQ